MKFPRAGLLAMSDPARPPEYSVQPADELTDIIVKGRVQTLFQPIIDTFSRATLGFEALSRGPADSSLHSPMELFAIARDSGFTVALEECCLKRAVERFRDAKLDGRLFLNLSPSTLLASRVLSARLAHIFEQLGLPASRCVLEITEQSLFEDYGMIRKALNAFRDVGCEIAVDDLGAGYSGLKTWSEVRPDYVKIDRYFVSSVHADGVKAQILRSIVEMSRAIGSRVIAEGVETAEECLELLDIGVDYLQGYFFGEPRPDPSVNAQALEHLAVQSGGAAAMCADHLVIDELRRIKGLAKARRGTSFLFASAGEARLLYPAAAAEPAAQT